MGAMLARLHLAAQDFAGQQPHLRGLRWWRRTVPAVLPFLDPARAALLRDELAFQQAQSATDCRRRCRAARSTPTCSATTWCLMGRKRPGGAPVSGIFDFYFAGIDSLLFDLAVCLNDWCIDPASGRMIDARADALCAAYQQLRPLSAGERQALPAMLRAAALRFWLSRLWDQHLPRDAPLLQANDPAHFERVLRERIDRPWHAAPH